MDLIKARRSIRRYKDQPVEKEKLLALAEAACYAPSAVNQRPWNLYFVTEKGKKEALCLVSPGAKAGTTAPCILVLTFSKAVKVPGMAPLDASFAAENLMLKATELGLGTVFLGIYPVEERIASVKKIVEVGEDEEVLGLIAIGYPDEEKPTPERYEEGKVHFLE